MDDATNNNSLLNDKQAAPLLGVAPATLRSWRCRGIGPAYTKFPGLRGGVRYDLRDIAEFRERCRCEPSVRAAFEGK
jgi:Helix-turn-helix domain